MAPDLKRGFKAGRARSISSRWDAVVIPKDYEPDKNAVSLEKVDLAFFRHLLKEKLEELGTQLKAAEAVQTSTPNAADFMEVAAHRTEQITSSTRAPDLRRIVNKIEAAIGKIEASAPEGSDYGFCEDSGEFIGVSRLMAHPWATRTMEAQQKHENDSRMGLRAGRNFEDFDR